MTRPPVHVALPWLEDAARDALERQSLPELPALAWLGGRGRISPLAQPSWRHWLLEAAGLATESLLQHWPAGPCLAAMAGLDAERGGTWACAQPTHLAAAMDHLRLAALPQVDLSASERASLVSAINAQLADRGFALLAPLDDTWVLRCPGSIECRTHEPAVAMGQNIHDFMPSGRDGARVRSRMYEIQMVLHEHPVNEARTRRHAPVINTVWLWGFGATLAPRQMAGPVGKAGLPLVADDPWLRALWRLHGGAATPWGPLQPAEFGRDGCIAVAQPPADDTARALAAIDATLLEPLRAAFAAGHVTGVELLIGSRVIKLAASARYRFWRRASTARIFS
jgi:hypothetical protein